MQPRREAHQALARRGSLETSGARTARPSDRRRRPRGVALEYDSRGVAAGRRGTAPADVCLLWAAFRRRPRRHRCQTRPMTVAVGSRGALQLSIVVADPASSVRWDIGRMCALFGSFRFQERVMDLSLYSAPLLPSPLWSCPPIGQRIARTNRTGPESDRATVSVRAGTRPLGGVHPPPPAARHRHRPHPPPSPAAAHVTAAAAAPAAARALGCPRGRCVRPTPPAPSHRGGPRPRGTLHVRRSTSAASLAPPPRSRRDSARGGRSPPATLPDAVPLVALVRFPPRRIPSFLGAFPRRALFFFCP